MSISYTKRAEEIGEQLETASEIFQGFEVKMADRRERSRVKIKEPTIVVNISNTDAIISGPEPRKVLHPRKLTILEGNGCSQ